jgi:hypothetical protein
MELRKFVSQALCDIADGVLDAQKRIEGGELIPDVADTFKSVETGISGVQPIDFEVAVTTEEKSGSEAKLSVVAGLIGGNVKGSSGLTNAHVATLRFRIPIRFIKHGGDFDT